MIIVSTFFSYIFRDENIAFVNLIQLVGRVQTRDKNTITCFL